MTFGYIYKTTNLINHKIYVGQHKWSGNTIDRNYFGSGKSLLKAIRKYGIQNFRCEIIDWCYNDEDMNNKEIFWIDFLQSTNRAIGYNHSDGGYVPRLSGEHNGNYGNHRPHTEEEKRHLSNVTKGHKPTFTRKHTDEERAKMGEKSREWNLTNKDYKQLSEHNKGSKMMTNGIEQHWVYVDDIDTMLEQGWWVGSCKKRQKINISENLSVIPDYIRNSTKLNIFLSILDAL